MLTVGVDLAAEPKGTAVAQIEWVGGKASLRVLETGVLDTDIVPLAVESQKTGIDCALGWPVDFIDFLNNHRNGIHEFSEEIGSVDWRRNISFRETDRAVRELTGRWPLSVATDRLGVTALRCAGLLVRLAEAGVNTDRAGERGVVEVYPAGALAIWGFDRAGYRDSAEVRRRLIGEITNRANWLKLGSFQELMVESCDAFDAVIACLATRAAAIGKSSKPAPHQMATARIEGWIALPLVPVESLI